MRNFIEITGICIPILTKQYAHANGKCEKKACFAYRTSWDGQQSERDDHFSTYLVQLSIINKPNPMIFSPFFPVNITPVFCGIANQGCLLIEQFFLLG